MPKCRVSFALMGFLLAVTILRCADTPWKGKVPADWSADDIRRILDNSPWSQMALVSATWVLSAEHESRTVARTQVGIVRGQPEGDPIAGSEASTRAFREKVIHWVPWTSSKTVQEALLRFYGQAAASLNPASARRTGAREYYLLILHGDDMRPFAKQTEPELKGKTWLRSGVGKSVLRPGKIEKDNSARGGELRQVLFFFPRNLPDRKKWNAAREQQTEFRSEGCQAVVQVKF
jgi:hypothetical protein